MIDQDRYPEIAFHLRFEPFIPFELCFTSKMEWNAKRGEQFLHTDAIVEEVKKLLAPVCFKDLQVLYIYGSGLGAYYADVLPWLKAQQANRLVILEDDLGAIDACARSLEGSRMLQDPQVHLKYIPNLKGWRTTLEECASQLPYKNVEVICLPQYFKKKSARFRSIRLNLMKTSLVWNSFFYEAAYFALLNQNILRNLKQLPHSFFVNSWKGKFKGVPAIICGAGPSLASFKEALLEWKDRALIIAGGSTLSALGHLKIRPHLGLIVDPNEEEYTAIKNCPFRDLPLLFCSRVNPEALGHFIGPKGYVRSKTGGEIEAWMEEKLGMTLPPIGPDMGREAFSVTTLAIPLAKILGCDPIILVGVDLAYSNQEKYSPGVASFTSSSDPSLKFFRENGEKKPVETHLKWEMEADAIGKYAHKKKKTRFFRAGLAGLPIRHIKSLSKEEISTQLSLKNLDLESRINAAIFQSKCTFPPKKIEDLYALLLKEVEEAILCVEEIFCAAQQDSLESGKKMIAESDLKEMEIYTLLVEPLLIGFTTLMKPTFFLDFENPNLEEKQTLEIAKWRHVKESLELVKRELIA